VPRIYAVPGGKIGAWIVTLLPLFYAALASYFILIPNQGTLTNDGVDRITYELTQFIPLLIIVLLTTGMYIWGQLEKRNKYVVVELNLDGPAIDAPAETVVSTE
jgi:hypothetical protein